jgi:methyl-accepting chemotaxis protein
MFSWRTDNSEAIRLLAANTITANVMVADANLKIVYMNKAVMTLLKAESDIQKDLPKFSTAALIGSSIDVFHKNPAHQRKLLENWPPRTGQRSGSAAARSILSPHR